MLYTGWGIFDKVETTHGRRFAGDRFDIINFNKVLLA